MKTFYLSLTTACVVVGVFTSVDLIIILNALPKDVNALDFTYSYSVS
jgi:hypothetical protein